MAAKLADPRRFCGLHFFHPVGKRPLVEVIRGPRTSDEAVAIAAGFGRAVGKLPLLVGDGPGFLVNRLLVPYLTEGLELLLDGATMDQVESAATAFGMAMGPLRLLDEIGLDTALRAGRVLWRAFPERIIASPLLVSMYKAGRMGRKAGAGFFLYPAGLAAEEPGRNDPAVAGVIAKWARATKAFTSQAIVDRLLLPMVLEASRVLQEGVAGDPGEIDLGVLFGLGFPAARGGLLWWADTLGADQIVQRAATDVADRPTDAAQHTAGRHGRERTAVLWRRWRSRGQTVGVPPLGGRGGDLRLKPGVQLAACLGLRQPATACEKPHSPRLFWIGATGWNPTFRRSCRGSPAKAGTPTCGLPWPSPTRDRVREAAFSTIVLDRRNRLESRL